MTSTDLITYITYGYLACGIGYLIAYLTTAEESSGRRWTFWSLLALWGLHTAAISWRWVDSYHLGIGHAPLSNLYESLVFYGWTIGLALIVARWRFKLDLILVLGLPLLFLTMAYTFLQDPTIRPLVPALQSNWLTVHVITCFLGYAGFAVSFVAAVVLLISRKRAGDRKAGPRSELLDEIVYRSVLVGYPLLTMGIITGAAWANSAWGNYWTWDPKETWSLITWLVYAAFLHARLARGWTGRRTALLSVLGFTAVLFTFLGVNMLLPGLHSYF